MGLNEQLQCWQISEKRQGSMRLRGSWKMTVMHSHRMSIAYDSAAIIRWSKTTALTLSSGWKDCRMLKPDGSSCVARRGRRIQSVYLTKTMGNNRLDSSVCAYFSVHSTLWFVLLHSIRFSFVGFALTCVLCSCD